MSKKEEEARGRGLCLPLELMRFEGILVVILKVDF
jgi:hypothetical protein